MLILSFSITTKCRSCAKRRKSRIRRKGRKGGLGCERCESDRQVSQSTKATPSFAKGQRCSEFHADERDTPSFGKIYGFGLGAMGGLREKGKGFGKVGSFGMTKGIGMTYRTDTTNRTNTRGKKRGFRTIGRVS